MLVRKNFFDPFLCPEKILRPEKIFYQGINLARDYKKKIDTAKNFEKIFVHAGNVPPPPHHFSNGPSLSFEMRQNIFFVAMSVK